MKKGISLIVLVITIIVMIIIAGAIILSFSSSNVTGKAKWATVSSDRANYQAELALQYADYMSENEGDATGFTYTPSDANFAANGFEVDGTEVIYTGDAVDGVPTTPPAWYRVASAP